MARLTHRTAFLSVAEDGPQKRFKAGELSALRAGQAARPHSLSGVECTEGIGLRDEQSRGLCSQPWEHLRGQMKTRVGDLVKRLRLAVPWKEHPIWIWVSL